MSKYSALRPYGPGKFYTMLDAAVWEASLDGGPDEESGSVDELGWSGLVRAPILDFIGHDELWNGLTPEEQGFVAAHAGAILFEDSQGFVSVDYFETAAALDAAWAKVVAEDDAQSVESGE
jgi:hypothetical protein